MTTLTAHGVLLAAAPEQRTVTYRLLPFGQPGRTSIGLVTATPGVVTIPDPQSVVLNMEHDPTRPVGRLLSATEHDDALHATFRIAATPAGDALLAEVAEGLRTGVSVELDQVRVRDGALLAGALTGAGAVTRPAFQDARALLVASDTEDPDTDDTDDAGTPPASDPDTDATPAPDDPAGAPADGEDTPVSDDTLTASAPTSVPPVTTTARDTDLSTVARMFASVATGDRDPDLLAALSDLTLTKVGHSIAPAWIGEAWSGNDYQRSIVPLFAQGNLTGPKVQGWRWKTAPAGADYAGDKADVTSNAAETEAVEFVALRFAGAHDHDRAMVDFGVPDYWTSYWDAMSASYKKWSDTHALTAAKGAATAVTMTGKSAVGCIVAGALAVMPAGRPTFCLLGADPFTALAEQDPLAFLSGTLSIPDGNGGVGGLSFGTHPGLAAGDVIVGVRNAATWYELGGGAPIRAEGLNIAKGGVDTGAFGYGVLGIHDAAGIAKGTYVAPAPAAP
jgi:hypothetical protein